MIAEAFDALEQVLNIKNACAFCEAFFTYYNHEHRHSGIGRHTPASVHFGTAEQIRARRAATLAAAYQASPLERPCLTKLDKFRKPRCSGVATARRV
ncbi:integrase core domain-containing protein [Streptosporangium roseum]|uniref:integrase core domain-containing protein n=1 Tax=Streptosporangium roseum TaxID=2001 RepID=UPI0004CC99B5